MMKYEYVTVPVLSHATKQILDNWGSEGWELIQLIPKDGSLDFIAVFKREVK